MREQNAAILKQVQREIRRKKPPIQYRLYWESCCPYLTSGSSSPTSYAPATLCPVLTRALCCTRRRTGVKQKTNARCAISLRHSGY